MSLISGIPYGGQETGITVDRIGPEAGAGSAPGKDVRKFLEGSGQATVMFLRVDSVDPGRHPGLGREEDIVFSDLGICLERIAAGIINEGESK